MSAQIQATLTGTDANAYAHVVSLARNDYPQNAEATLEEILGAAFTILALDLTDSQLRQLQRGVAKRVHARQAAEKARTA